MNCAVLSKLYVRSNGDVPCYDDAGEDIILGRVQLRANDWDVKNVVEGPLYNSVRQALREQRIPWPGVCERCALFRPNGSFSDALASGLVHTLQVEPSLACNLRCLCCSQPQQVVKRPKPFKMPFELFDSLLTSLHDNRFTIREIEYCGQGEAMTNPRFNEFVETARRLYPRTLQRLITNGNFDYGKSMMTTAIDEIIVSCDGARQESYERYRVGGRFETALAFMRDVPKMVGGYHQTVIWKYILFEFNDSDEEIVLAQRLAAENGVDGLLFVFTHSDHKSVRYRLENAHELPIVWARASVDATPIQFADARDFVPTHAPAPIEMSPDGDVRFVLDNVATLGAAGLYLHGWALAEARPIHRVRVIHNGEVVGESDLGRARPDVLNAFPEYRGVQPGFALAWRPPTLPLGLHRFLMELVAIDGTTIASFSREYELS